MRRGTNTMANKQHSKQFNLIGNDSKRIISPRLRMSNEDVHDHLLDDIR